MTLFKKHLSDLKKHDSLRRFPVSDWKRVLILSGILIATSLFLGSYIFWMTEKDGFSFDSYESNVSGVDTINKDKLDFWNSFFNKRSVESVEILKQKPQIIDPSV